MVTIGNNLKYERSTVVAVDSKTIELKISQNNVRKILISDVKHLEITGIKSGSGFSGTMEWGMRNPTFILPTTIWNNIISLFKRRNDTFHYLVTLSDDTKLIIVCNDNELNQQFRGIVKKCLSIKKQGLEEPP